MEDYTRLIGKAQAGTRNTEVPLKDPLPMVLRVPTAPHRPGDTPCFAPLTNQTDDLPKPDTLAPYDELREHATGLIRVLNEDGHAEGPWRPKLGPQQLRSGLEMMLRARHL